MPDRNGIVSRGRLINQISVQEPEGWAERYAVYWRAQEAWACDAEGVSCEPWDAPRAACAGRGLGS